MSSYTVAVIGTGPDPNNPTVDGFAMGYRHGEAFESDTRCELVGCADIVEENRLAFADTFGLPAENAFEEYEEMLSALKPDIVSVAVPPAIHRDIVVGCAKSGVVDAIHCEKPMANVWADARQMAQECWRHDVQLTLNRQRRFGRLFTEAKRLLDDGKIGSLRRIEIGWGDFFDTGAHTVDLAGMYNDDRAAEWVLAGLDYREEDLRFGAHQENQMWAQWRYENGVYGVVSTGEGGDFIDAAMVLRGTGGTIRIDKTDGPMLELDCNGDRRAVDVNGETMHATNDEADDCYGSQFHDRAVNAVVDGVESGEEPCISARTGLTTAEILFAGYESVRRRGRVDLPLDVTDNPLESMVNSGALSLSSPAVDDN
ncbi:Gfo/Idh/MocA family protein [Natrialba taiwanensis]|uniref:Oxidoreductase domain protein n=1 Tax=Natrialba taiwanensis DSM 12281 TaxID=1230458 RepID=M0AED5_9EURY|nr:Gfo/Idh/MocA family oxidoreductase [Natrialba taiwanensis]ELY96894.1 oxidoreductase domain protein [Natrialba taiwanensis DSM 12281]